MDWRKCYDTCRRYNRRKRNSSGGSAKEIRKIHRNIGNNTQIGPNCQFLTPNHPIDYIERRKPIERCSPITIDEDCWLGGDVVVCPGVTIGDRCIIGAGSVVVKDIPSDSLVVGNPCKVVRKIQN